MQVEISASRFLSIHPVMFFLSVVGLLWLGTIVGGRLRRHRERTLSEESSTFKTLESAVLALLGLLLGFTFSMGVSRYDQRKNLEITEANEIHDVWIHSSTLPGAEREALQALLLRYVPVRLDFLDAGTSRARIDASLSKTADLQQQLWRVSSTYAESHSDPVSAQLLSEVTAMVNVTESRTAAFENRIPVVAWGMLLFISFMASILVGVGISSHSQFLRIILPIVVASALSLTLDLDSPRSGIIRVHQHSLERVQQVMLTGPRP